MTLFRAGVHTFLAVLSETDAKQNNLAPQGLECKPICTNLPTTTKNAVTMHRAGLIE